MELQEDISKLSDEELARRIVKMADSLGREYFVQFLDYLAGKAQEVTDLDKKYVYYNLISLILRYWSIDHKEEAEAYKKAAGE